jgi:hypothetical protein
MIRQLFSLTMLETTGICQLFSQYSPAEFYEISWNIPARTINWEKRLYSGHVVIGPVSVIFIIPFGNNHHTNRLREKILCSHIYTP